MAIVGVHALLYTSEPDALRDVLSTVFAWDHVDAGEGWLIFRLPPTELGVHPAESPAQELTLMCDDLESTLSELEAAGVTVLAERHEEDWGVIANIRLPGGVDMMVYEPRHPTAI